MKRYLCLATVMLSCVASCRHALAEVYSFTTLTGLADDLPVVGARDARFGTLAGVATDSAGNIYLTDVGAHVVRKISPAGVVTKLAGSNGVAGNSDGAGSGALFKEPSRLAVDLAGNVYVADTGNHTIRKITATGVVTTLAGVAGEMGNADGTGAAARFNSPRGIAVTGNGTIFVADTENQSIRRITPAGQVSTFVGRAASLRHPLDLARPGRGYRSRR